MIRAILEGRETQTRRIIKPQPDDDGLWDDDRYPRSLQSTLKGWNGSVDETGEGKEWKCRYGAIGDVLWVRETWAYLEFLGPEDADYVYKASDNGMEWANNSEGWRWRPSIFMPKEACRIRLKITDIRVERVQEITPGDACEEGVEYSNIDKDAFEGGELQADFTNYMWRDDEKSEDYHFPTYANPVLSFRSLWHKINGAASWEQNVWIWVIQFEVI